MAATATMLRPALHLRLTQALPSPVGLEMKQRHCSAGRRLWATRRVPAVDAQAVAGAPEAYSSGDGMDKTTEEIKAELYLALEGIDRGIFGLKSAKKMEIEAMVEKLESRNPTPNPTDHLLSKVDGCWKLIYTTVTILGSKRTKLGLRDFISLGDIYQTIDAAQERAVNVIHFSAKGLRMLAGRLTIQASYTIASKSVRSSINFFDSIFSPALPSFCIMRARCFRGSTSSLRLRASRLSRYASISTKLEHCGEQIRASFLIGAANSMEQFAGLFEKNYDLLITVFNPEGWLDITDKTIDDDDDEIASYAMIDTWMNLCGSEGPTKEIYLFWRELQKRQSKVESMMREHMFGSVWKHKL